MKKLRTREVFVPGGQPVHTYVPRDEHGLEVDIRSAADNLCKLVTVTGPTKSGKSVLVRRIFPRSSAVWIDGGSVTAEDDLWSQVVEQLNASTGRTTETSGQGTASAGIQIGAEVGIGILAKASGQVAGSYSRTTGDKSSASTTITPRAAALDALQERKLPLIIDDFHYLNHDLQAAIVRAVKGPIFDGLPVIFLAIPHRRYDAIRVEREMTGRVQQVAIPAWSRDELRHIPLTGLRLLNAIVDDAIVELFISEAIGSPHLVQEFCRDLCIKGGVEEATDAPTALTPQPTAQALLRSIAVDLSRPVFESLAQGPRVRTDRMKRRFKDGRTGDIYLAVLNAIAKLRPDIATYQYEDIRAALRDVLEDLPEAHEVARVLEHMSSIQADKGASVPVLDWEKKNRRLHIVDPYFAFFLRWGADVFLQGTRPKDASEPPTQ